MISLLQFTNTLTTPLPFIDSPETLFFSFLKLLFIVGIVIYLVFSGLVIRQIDLMSRTVESPSSGIMKLLGYIHLGIVIFVFFLYILLL